MDVTNTRKEYDYKRRIKTFINYNNIHQKMKLNKSVKIMKSKNTEVENKLDLFDLCFASQFPFSHEISVVIQ